MYDTKAKRQHEDRSSDEGSGGGSSQRDAAGKKYEEKMETLALMVLTPGSHSGGSRSTQNPIKKGMEGKGHTRSQGGKGPEPKTSQKGKLWIDKTVRVLRAGWIRVKRF